MNFELLPILTDYEKRGDEIKKIKLLSQSQPNFAEMGMKLKKSSPLRTTEPISTKLC